MNKVVKVCKTGYDHLFADKNRQDFVVSLPNLKIVIDGCGSAPFSDVGAMLFGQLISQKYESLTIDNFESYVREIFINLVCICPGDDEFRTNNFSFTILACFETEDEFVVMSCGDGYIITQIDGEIFYQKLDDGEFPKYYIYNYILDKSSLLEYKKGVDFSVFHFPKEDYDNVGVATDGFRFIDNLEDYEKKSLSKLLVEQKVGKVCMLINRNIGTIKDDISICF